MCLAQGYNAEPPVRLEPATLRSPVKHYTNALPDQHDVTTLDNSSGMGLVFGVIKLWLNYHQNHAHIIIY